MSEDSSDPSAGDAPGEERSGGHSQEQAPVASTEAGGDRDTSGDFPDRLVHGTAGAPPVPSTSDVDLGEPGWYLNRELSALSFQKRVLNEALDPRNPRFERVRFLELFTRNTDEFCMKRIGGLKQQLAGNVTERTPDGRLPGEQLDLVCETLEAMFERQDRGYAQVVEESLPEAGIEICEYESLSADVRAALREYFTSEVLPTLTPLSVTPGQALPFISNLSLSLAVRTRTPDEPARFTRIKVPENRPRLLHLPTVAPAAGSDDADGRPRDRFVFLEDVIGHNLDHLFPNVEVLEWSTFRVTRNAEVTRNEEVAEGLISMIEGLLRDRRFATVVRLEVAAEMSAELRAALVEGLDVGSREVFERRAPLNLGCLERLRELDRPDLALPPWTPRQHPRFADTPDGESRDPFAVIREGDVIVHHPYQSFEGTVQRFIAEAATDDSVLAIKVAIYRTTRDSQIIENLIAAARNGKEVAVMVELKARFDEENNLRWVRRLEEEGIHVAYGTVDLKAHCKTALVVRREAAGVELYSHVGTGNYHAETAKAYVDLGLLTTDRAVGRDLVKLFNAFTGHSRPTYEKLLVAPGGLRSGLVERIEREAAIARDGGAGRIIAKMNALEDPDLTAALYRAAMDGVEIDLLVRDICRLRPGVDGVSETVTVRSVVGRFLEHSRIFHFANDGDPEYLIGSADWMGRNLDRRVEAVVPVEDPALQSRLDEILDLYLTDTRRTWELQSDGSYVQRRDDDTASSRDVQSRLMERATAAERTGTDTDE